MGQEKEPGVVSFNLQSISALRFTPEQRLQLWLPLMPGVQDSPPRALAAVPGSSAHFPALILAQNGDRASPGADPCGVSL